MMSNPASDKYTDMIREIERKKLYAGIKLETVDADESLSVLWIKAAAIRLYLFRQLCVMNNKMLPQKTDEDISIIVPRILRSKTITLFHSNKLQDIIQNLRFFCRKPEQLDYISNVKNDGGFLYDLYGERYLLTEILQRNKNREIETLLFLYLAIRNHFRSELVQCNSLIGFDNFSKYQSRKDWFLDDDDQMEMRLASATISSVLCGPKIHSLEMRITPSLSNSEDVSPAMLNIRKIRGYDEAIRRVLNRSEFDYTIDRFYYTMHFPKETESLDECNVYFCRHHKLREKNEIRAEGLLGMQEIAPEVALRVRGIDACSKEIECRPEVFGPVFRKLQDYNKDHELPQFQVTYHVAEHNYDIVDGLRAIHEAIIFLGLRSGSRLGHATFLGIPADQFYAGKGMSISMPLQNYIDNLVWMYFFMLKNLEAFPKAQIVLDFIRSKYCEHIHTLFGDQADSSTLPSIEEYNLAWLLRGDEPSLYQDPDPDKWRQPHSYDSYMLCNSVPEIGQARTSKKIRHFYHMYHYDKNIRRNGCTSVCETVTSEIVEIIGNIQNAMKKMISKKEISIECNPSSNLFISPIQGYHQHPIHILFDKGLTVRSFQKTQLNVSVNTDDQSVFSTSISNEYAYLAFSLESETNGTSYSAADIYEWIELLKRNGNAQSFLNIGFVPNKTMQALLKEEPGERRR